MFCAAIGVDTPTPEGVPRSSDDEVLVWTRCTGRAPRWVKPDRSRQMHRRHTRKYAEGDLGAERSFFFRGPGNRHNLRAQNLMIFAQMAEGIDEETWMFHLRRGDYSRWFRSSVKDRYLSEQTERIEQRHDLQPAETRRLIRSLIDARYTLPE